MSQSQDNKAMDYFNRGLKIHEEIGNKSGIAGFLNNIGSIAERQGNHKKSLDYFERSLKLREQLGDKRGQASSLWRQCKGYRNA
jgi:Tfp pilus assembly protein PilF